MFSNNVGTLLKTVIDFWLVYEPGNHRNIFCVCVGNPGLMGVNGSQGPRGPPGPDGEDGAPGKNGKSLMWSSYPFSNTG